MRAEDFCEVVITAPDGEWLAGFVHDEVETRAAVHVRAALVPAILERTAAEHPYEVPGVVVLSIAAGGPGYLEWIAAETRDPGRAG